MSYICGFHIIPYFILLSPIVRTHFTICCVRMSVFLSPSADPQYPWKFRFKEILRRMGACRDVISLHDLSGATFLPGWHTLLRKPWQPSPTGLPHKWGQKNECPSQDSHHSTGSGNPKWSPSDAESALWGRSLAGPLSLGRVEIRWDRDTYLFFWRLILLFTLFFMFTHFSSQSDISIENCDPSLLC